MVKLIKCEFFCLCAPKRCLLNTNLAVRLTLCFGFPSTAGSYVALTVLGRPPGLTQIPLSEAETEMLGVSISSPNSPAAERPYSPQDRFSSAHPSWVGKIRPTSRVQSVLLSPRLAVVIWISSCSHISGCFFVSSFVETYATFPVYISPVVLMYSPSECLSASRSFFPSHRTRTAASATRKLTSCKRCSPESRSCRLA